MEEKKYPLLQDLESISFNICQVVLSIIDEKYSKKKTI